MSTDDRPDRPDRDVLPGQQVLEQLRVKHYGEYLQEPQRGFWEERGYRLRGDPWQEERYSYQETRPRRLGDEID